MSATALPIGPPGRAFVRGIGLAFSFQIPAAPGSAPPSDRPKDRPTAVAAHRRPASKSIKTHEARYDRAICCRVMRQSPRWD